MPDPPTVPQVQPDMLVAIIIIIIIIILLLIYSDLPDVATVTIDDKVCG